MNFGTGQRAYGSWNQELMGTGGDAITKAMEEWTKKVEEVGLKVVFWGSPFGVSENAIVVTKGAVEDYLKLIPLKNPIHRIKNAYGLKMVIRNSSPFFARAHLG